MDETDKRLVDLLSQNARVSVAVLARQLNMARTTVQARIERLEDQGIIAGYTLRQGPVLQPAFRATVLISVEPRAGAAVLARLRPMTEVIRVHTVSGRVDLLVELVAENSEDLDKSLDKIADVQGVTACESLIHLSTKIDRDAQLSSSRSSMP